MFKAAKFTVFATTASILALGAAYAQESEEADDQQSEITAEAQMEAEAEVDTAQEAETSVEAESKALTESELTTIAEDRLAEADTDGDEALTEDEYINYTRAFAGEMQDTYGARIDTDNELEGSGTKIDVTSSGSIEEMRKRNTASIYDNAVNEDKVKQAASARFAEINMDGTVSAASIVSGSSTAFREADTDGDELIEGEELDRYASTVTGLKLKADAETGAEADTQTEEDAQG